MLYLLVSSFLGSTFLLHLALHFPAQWRWGHSAALIGLLYLPTLLASLLGAAYLALPLGSGPRETAQGAFLLSHAVVSNLFSVAALALVAAPLFRRTAPPPLKRQAGLLVGGMLAASLPYLLAAAAGAETDPWNLAIVALPVAFTLALLCPSGGATGERRPAARASAVLLVLTTRVGCPVAVAAPAAAAPAAGEIVMPSERCGDLFIVPLTTGDSGSVKLDMLLDTSSRWTLVDPQSLRRALGGRLASGRVTLAGSRVGEHRLAPLRIRPLEMDAFGLAIGRKLDGILGFPAFADVLLTLDYPAAEVRVASGGLPVPDGRTVLRDVGFRRPQVRLGPDARRVRMLVDSGSTQRFLFKTADRLLWSVEPRPVATTLTAYGVAVDAAGRLAGSLRLGPGRFDEPVVRVANRERTVGGAALRHFTVTFDQRNDRIRLQTAESAPLPTPPLVGSGLGIRFRREGLEVAVVFAGTPAQAAGFEVGDLIVAVDGVPVHARSCSDRELPPVGARRQFSYLRDGVAAKATIEYGVLVP